MPSSYTQSLRLILPVTGELTGTWGDAVNAGLTELVEDAIAGTADIAMANANVTLTTANEAADQARNMFLNLTGANTAQRDVIVPAVSKLYFVHNGTTGGFGVQVKTAAGTGVVVPNGQRMALYCDGTNVLFAFGSSVGRDVLLAADAAAARMAAGVPNSGPLSGLRNLIINGNFSVNQRAYASGTAVGAANTYTLDRWRVVTSGQNASYVTSGAGRLVTAPAGGFEQVIEGASIGGGTYVINWTGTATCTVNGTARAKGATFTLTAGSNATVRFSSGTVTEVQLEPGEVVTAFELRPAAVELMLCQRYFETGSGYGWGYAGSAGNHRCAYTPWKVTKRASPSVATSNVAYTNASGISAEFIDASKSGYYLAAAAAGFFAVSFDWTASAEL